MTDISRPLRLNLDGNALVDNWRTLAGASGSAATGAAVKADGYGLGARSVVQRLSAAGCRNFFVANWTEAAAIADLVPPQQIAVLNGVVEQDVPVALSLGAIPVLNTPRQIALWKSAGGGICHVMLDSGINRLGIGPEQIFDSCIADLEIDILLSHLASADQDVPQNPVQLAVFVSMTDGIRCIRRSFANSAGIQLGADYHFDLTRPGLSLYGGITRPELANELKQVAKMQAQVLQVRTLTAGQSVGYNATYRCREDTRVATLAIGYADGYLRGFSDKGQCYFDGQTLPVIGRVSMDLLTIDATTAPALVDGDWVDVEYGLVEASISSGLSQYELLTGLSDRFDRHWK